MSLTDTNAKEQEGTSSYLLKWFPENSHAFLRFFGFNTLVSVSAYAGDSSDEIPKRHQIENALEDVYKKCCHYEELFSRTIETSDISKLNTAQGNTVRIHADTYHMLESALHFCEISDGAFDITIGAATMLWDFHEGHVAKSHQLKDAISHIDWHGLHLFVEGDAYYARLTDAQAKVDVGGFAKGWIADRLIELLNGSGASAMIVDLGGIIVVSGIKPDRMPWRIGLRDPRTSLSEETYIDVIELTSGSVATSGVYERCFSDEFGSYHHILDARTGQPLETSWSSVSVIAETATYAEGFSTTFLAHGPETAKRFIKEEPQISQAIFIDPQGNLTIVD